MSKADILKYLKGKRRWYSASMIEKKLGHSVIRCLRRLRESDTIKYKWIKIERCNGSRKIFIYKYKS